MRLIFPLFKKKEKRTNYFELPAKTQKSILEQTIKGTSDKKRKLLEKYSLRFSK
ncbi:MAG: hypothetical protein UX44_C0004G0016 [candidate division WWE3 bacterium GW2011_GWA1_46_21]|uniref:Uncharacterized protein n=3 Tax=Katanobacteria TaxID=422282 RepID=A0A0G1PG84_UNCKA|nr:MAG: hypothetical protein UX44_C0004G0016 [candidate division WWE3 bacterium GW2011_GWA1_46_21]KKU50830.1 MAG: hypothetical protein UX73_C0013G0007 [candidate division WWE3 bacterium GW2011_GWC1_47_10]KKU57675.1 MAG: hypothetical protein UX79_C0006G0011 [candidate division WWE3 bacterium GW2011_GWB1_47_11]